MVVLYRGAWCPYCNITLSTYQEHLVPALTARGVPLIAISPQRPDGSLSMQEKHDRTYTVLSDPGNQIAGKLGVLTAPTDGVVDAQASLGVDLTEVNADGTHALPMATVAIVDADGVLRWIDVHPNYATRTEPETPVAAVAAWASSGAVSPAAAAAEAAGDPRRSGPGTLGAFTARSCSVSARGDL